MKLSLKELHDVQNFNKLIGCNLYIVKYQGIVLYVGISRDHVYNRWFGIRGHIHTTPDGRWINADSTIGELVVLNQPQSHEWEIEVMEIDNKLLGIKERELIGKYHPCANKTYNLKPNQIPKDLKQDLRSITPDLETTASDFIPLSGD